MCPDAGLIIPTIAFDNNMMMGALNPNNFETYCGAVLNEISGTLIGGTVESMLNFTGGPARTC